MCAVPPKTHDFIITNHVRERFVERFSPENRKVYAHLSQCRQQSCSRCTSLVWKMKKEIDNNRHYLDKMICARLHEAKETHIHHNDMALMERMHQKYGYQKFHFLISDDILFVVIAAERGKVAVTCMDARNNSYIGAFVRRPKYKKKEPALV